MYPLLPTFLLILTGLFVYMTLWFFYGFRYLKRIDSVDVAWGLGFIYVALITIMLFADYSTVSLLCLLFVAIWGLRLSLHIGSRSLSKSEDRRYAIYREKWKKNLALNVYLKIFLLQGVLISIVSTPIVGIIAGEDFLVPLAVLGFVVWAFGIVYESIADYQLRKFVKIKKSKDEIMNHDLWKYSRHPNYFGEITAWVGATLVACSAGNYWTIVGPALLVYLILKISGLPPIEKRYKNNKNYQEYKAKTPALIPLFPKN